jgi:hypothetical protein
LLSFFLLTLLLVFTHSSNPTATLRLYLHHAFVTRGQSVQLWTWSFTRTSGSINLVSKPILRGYSKILLKNSSNVVARQDAVREIEAIFPRAGTCRMGKIVKGAQCKRDILVARDDEIEAEAEDIQARAVGKKPKISKAPAAPKTSNASTPAKTKSSKSPAGKTPTPTPSGACKNPAGPAPPRSGASKRKPMTKPKARRDSAQLLPTKVTELQARESKVVTMGEVKTFDWTKEDWGYTNGLAGCSVIALMNKQKLVWSHFPPMRAGVDASHVDTWNHFLGEIERQAIAAGILDASGRAKADTFLVIRVHQIVWNLQQLPGGVPSAALMLYDWAMAKGLGGSKQDFATYGDEITRGELWINRVGQPSDGVPPQVYFV